MKITLISVVILIAFTKCDIKTVRQQEEESHTYQAAGYSRVEIETKNGKINSTAAQKDSIDITLTKWATGTSESDAKDHIKDISVSVTDNATGGTLRIFVDIPEQVSSTYGCDVVLSLPPPLYIDLVSSNGDIEAQGHESGLFLYTSNGSIISKATKGKADFTTSNGGITVGSHSGDIDAVTQNWEIDAKVIMPETNGHCRLISSNGDITAAIPASISADIMITSNGIIYVDPALHVTVIKNEDNIFEGSMGAAHDRGDITIEASNGNIKLSPYVP